MIKFRLKGKQKPISYAIPVKNRIVFYPKTKTYEPIGYFLGSTSILVNDPQNKGREIEPVVFEDGELLVPEHNIALLEYLRLHEWNNEYYEEFSESIDTERKLATLEEKAKAIQFVSDLNDAKIQAAAIAILGLHAFGWEPNKARAVLLEKAIESPLTILTKANDTDYESKYYAALVFNQKIVKASDDGKAIVWNQGMEGVVCYLGVEDNEIETLANYLNSSTVDARTAKNRIATHIKKADNEAKTENSKDKEIEELKQKLALLTGVNGAETVTGEPKQDSETETINFDDLTLEELTVMYEKKFEKSVSPFKKNDIEWIKNKLTE